MELMRLYKECSSTLVGGSESRSKSSKDPGQYLNINQFTFSCSPGISGMRYTWLMYTGDFL